MVSQKIGCEDGVFLRRNKLFHEDRHGVSFRAGGAPCTPQLKTGEWFGVFYQVWQYLGTVAHGSAAVDDEVINGFLRFHFL